MLKNNSSGYIEQETMQTVGFVPGAAGADPRIIEGNGFVWTRGASPGGRLGNLFLAGAGMGWGQEAAVLGICLGIVRLFGDKKGACQAPEKDV
jgi:hypothetical protein